MRKILVRGLAASIAVAGWTNVADARAVATTCPVIAILAGDLFLGEAEGHLDGTGTVAIRSQTKPDITCAGEFTYSAKLNGSGHLQCSDGATATFQFERMSVTRGHGVGSSSRGELTFTYGLTADQAARYLKLPRGKKLTVNGTALELVDS